MPGTLDDADWERFREQLQDEQTNAGVIHIAETLAVFRNELLKREFTDKQSFSIVREYFCVLIDRFYQHDAEED